MRLFVLFISLFGGKAYAQSIADSIPLNSDSVVYYEAIVTAENQSKDALYSKAKIWMADNFKNANYVIQSEDKVDGVLVAKGSFSYVFNLYTIDNKTKKVTTIPNKQSAKFTLKVFSKDNRYKVSISDIYLPQLMSIIKVGEYLWDYRNLNAIKRLYNERPNEKWFLEHSSEKRVLNEYILAIIQSIKIYMAKKSETDF